MWIIQEPNTLELWKKLHFEEENKTDSIYHVSNIQYLYLLNKYINENNTGTKNVRIIKQTAFWRGKNGEYIACLKYSVPIFVE